MAHSASVRRTVFLAAVLVAALASTTSSGASTAKTQATGRETVAAIDPVPRRRPRRPARHRRAGGRERRDERHDPPVRHRRPTRSRARRRAGRPCSSRRVSPSRSRLRSAANAMTIRYAIPDAPTGGGIDAPLTVSRGPRQRTRQHPSADDHADIEVLVPLQPVSVHERPERGPAPPGLVDHRVLLRSRRDDPDADHHETVQADALLRRSARAPRQDLPGRATSSA